MSNKDVKKAIYKLNLAINKEKDAKKKARLKILVQIIKDKVEQKDTLENLMKEKEEIKRARCVLDKKLKDDMELQEVIKSDERARKLFKDIIKIICISTIILVILRVLSLI